MFDWDDVFDFVEADVPSGDLGFLGDWQSGETLSPWDESGSLIIGTPFHDAEFHDAQNLPDSCAIVSQKMILEQFGIEISEGDLVYEAFANGLYTPGGGTSPLDAGKLLEIHGVGVHQVFGGSIEDLLAEIQQGHRVIVGVDHDELHNPESPFYDMSQADGGADHAIVVTGFTVDSNGVPLIHFNDPGHAGGAGNTIPLAEFRNAWSDSGNMYVATDEAPPGLGDDPVFGEFFNADTGMYMDMDFWKKLGFGVLRAGVIGVGVFAIGQGVKQTSDQVDAESTQIEISTNVTESFDDDQRNALLRAI
jgi:hypothetical protein